MSIRVFYTLTSRFIHNQIDLTKTEDQCFISVPPIIISRHQIKSHIPVYAVIINLNAIVFNFVADFPISNDGWLMLPTQVHS